MQKVKIKEVFGSYTNAAHCLGYHAVTICRWPDELPQRYADQVIQATIRVKGRAVAEAYFPELKADV